MKMLNILFSTDRVSTTDWMNSLLCKQNSAYIYTAPSVGLPESTPDSLQLIDIMPGENRVCHMRSVQKLASMVPRLRAHQPINGRQHTILLERPEFLISMRHKMEFCVCMAELVSDGHLLYLSTRDDTLLALINYGIAAFGRPDMTDRLFCIDPATCRGFDLDSGRVIFPKDDGYGFSFTSFDSILGDIQVMQEQIIWGD